MIRKKNLYSRPKKAYELRRIKEENEILKKYALKNKKEIWKTNAKVSYFRKRAMELARAGEEEQNVFFNKLNNLGLNVNNTADVLDLKIERLLERRLPTIVFKKNLATSVRQARQLVVHKKVMIENKVVNIPSYLVSVYEENLISVKQKMSKPKVSEEISAEPEMENSEGENNE